MGNSSEGLLYGKRKNATSCFILREATMNRVDMLHSVLKWIPFIGKTYKMIYSKNTFHRKLERM